MFKTILTDFPVLKTKVKTAFVQTIDSKISSEYDAI